MLNKKGFTLIELLAVIVVLAIILVIAVSNVSKTIKNTTISSFNSSNEILLKEVKNRIEQEKLGLDVEIECDDSDVEENKHCSKVYDISEQDYEMIVSVNENNIYYFLYGEGKFNNLDVNDKMVIYNIDIKNNLQTLVDKKIYVNNANSLIIKEEFEDKIKATLNSEEIVDKEKYIMEDCAGECKLKTELNALFNGIKENVIRGSLASNQEYNGTKYWEIIVDVGKDNAKIAYNYDEYKDLLNKDIFCYYRGVNKNLYARVWINKENLNIEKAKPNKKHSECLGRK